MRRFTLAFASMAALSLSACGMMDGGNTPKAGEYSTDMTLIEMEMPGMEPGMKEQMAGMLPKGQTACLTDEKIKEGSWSNLTDDMLKNMEAGGECKRIRDNNTDTVLDTEVQCKSAAEGEVTITMKGESQSDGMKATMTTAAKDPTGKAMKMVVQIESKRIGDCKE